MLIFHTKLWCVAAILVVVQGNPTKDVKFVLIDKESESLIFQSLASMNSVFDIGAEVVISAAGLIPYVGSSISATKIIVDSAMENNWKNTLIH